MVTIASACASVNARHMVFEFKIVGKFRDEMLNFTRDGGTKRRRCAGTLAQKQTKRVRVVADKFHKGRDGGADHAAAFGDTLTRLAHQLAQHQTALIDHGQAQFIHIAEMTIEGRWRNPGLARNFAQAQAGKTPLSAQLTECGFHQRTPGFSFCCALTPITMLNPSKGLLALYQRIKLIGLPGL
jgi:hypothetical protein